MRLAFVTPWNPLSAIARINAGIAVELARRGVAIAIIRSETGADAALEPLWTTLPVLPSGIASTDWLGWEFDLACYALGDNYRFHGDALRLLPSRPGVVLLHDVYVQSLLTAWQAATGRSELGAGLATVLYGTAPPAGATISWSA